MRFLAARIGLGACLVAGALLALANPAALLACVAYGAMGYLLVIRRPHNLIGWMLISIAVGASIAGVPLGPTMSARILDGTAPGWVPWFALLERLCAVAGISIALALLATIFPIGGWPRGGVGRLAAVGLAFIGLLVPLQGLAPTLRLGGGASDAQAILVANPIGIAPGWPGWQLLDPGGAAYLLGDIGLALCVLGFIIRFRRSVGTERLQDKWLVGSLAFLVAATVWGSVLVLVFSGAASQMDDPTVALASAVAWGPATIAVPLPPIAIAIAVLRYRLYEIDRIISRTISYGVLSAVLGAVYAAGFALLQAAFAPFTSGGGPIAVAASTLVVFALFQPLRRRIQGAMDRRFNRSRYDAQRTVEAFAARLRDEVDLARLRVALVDTVGDAVRPVSTTVWLRAGSEGQR